MSEKENISATVDPEVDAYLSRQDVNASGLINKLVQNHMSGNGSNKDLLEFRKQQLEKKEGRLAERLEDTRSELSFVNKQLEEHETEQQNVLQEAAETLSRHQLHEDSNPVEFWADKAEMDISEFLSEMESRIDE